MRSTTCKIMFLSIRINMNVFYINLDSQVGRRVHVEAQLERLGWNYSRFPAIEKADGRLGCAMSHLKIITMAKERGLSQVCIVEDDILFQKTNFYRKQLKKYLSSNPKFDVFLIAGNTVGGSNDGKKRTERISENVSRVYKSFTTTGYIVKCHYYDTLIANFKSSVLGLMKTPNDNRYAIDVNWLPLQAKDNWTMITPRTVTQLQGYSSIEEQVVSYHHVMLDLDHAECKKYRMTCVSAYWDVGNKHDSKKYSIWFHNTLCVNCPYVFFGDAATIEMVKRIRSVLACPTHYIECKIEDFYTYQYKSRMAATHPIHCPSVELNMIWNEKIFLLQKASKINPFQSDFFKWIDAGHCVYRSQPPPGLVFPDPDKLNDLPREKFIYSSSNIAEFDANYFMQDPLNCHHVSGTFVLHLDLIDTFVEIYKEYLHKMLNPKTLLTDQIVLTHIYKDKPELFYKISDGYGKIVVKLY
jgi:glycosyl transferase family 25